MTISGKIIFILIIFIFYSLSYLVSINNSIRAIQKLFVFIVGSILMISIIFSDKVFDFLAISLGVNNGPDGVLYLFIIFSSAINIIFLRKIQILDTRLTRIVQFYSINENNINKKKK